MISCLFDGVQGKVDAAQTPRWTKFYAPEMEQADKARSVASKSAFAQLEKVKVIAACAMAACMLMCARAGVGAHAGAVWGVWRWCLCVGGGWLEL